MTTPKIPPVPKGLSTAGRKLWKAVSEAYDLDEHEHALLLELSRITDRLDNLHAAIVRDGEIIEGLHGPKAHPALVEARQQAITAARLTAVLRMPDGEEGDESQGRRQRRVGVRGTYRLRGAS